MSAVTVGVGVLGVCAAPDAQAYPTKSAADSDDVARQNFNLFDLSRCNLLGFSRVAAVREYYFEDKLL